ncbi:unnamed protein product [Rhizopus stolonifer]
MLLLYAKIVQSLDIFLKIITNTDFTTQPALMTSERKGRKENKASLSKMPRNEKKRSRTATNNKTNNVDICKRCHRSGHKSARSPKCEHHVMSKQEAFLENLGQGYQAFTRKLPLTTCVTTQHVQNLQSKIIVASREVRNIVFRAQIFTNYYITLRSQQPDNNDISHCIFRQQFWYSVCQLVNSRRVTTSTNLAPNMIAVWNAFKPSFNSIVYDQTLLQFLAKACTELVTSYQSNMMEYFESRLLNFLYYRLQNIFMSMDPGVLKSIAKNYCY